MPRHRSFVRSFDRKPPNRSWAGISIAPVAVAASTKVVLATFALDNAGIDQTFIRNVGVALLRSDQAAASENQRGAFGMIVVSDRAAAVGATAIPGPITDIDDDGWLLYVPINQRFEFSSAVGFDPTGGIQYHFDSKAKRIVHDGQSVALIVENADSSFAFTVSMIFWTLTMVRGT